MTLRFPKQPAPGRLRQENQQSELIFSHAVGLRTAWTTFHPVSKNNRKTDSKKHFQHIQQRNNNFRYQEALGSQALWHMPVIHSVETWPTGLQIQGQSRLLSEFKANLGYTVRSYLKRNGIKDSGDDSVGTGIRHQVDGLSIACA